MSNKKGIPAEIKAIDGVEEFGYRVLWEKSDHKMSQHSYAVKTKSKGSKNVLVLSTMPPILGTTKDDGKSKPAIIKFYDFSKGGTDIIDQRMGFYSVSTKSRRWTMTGFSYILDTARVNAQSIYCANKNKNVRQSNSFELGWELALNLVRPHVMTRNFSKLKTNVITKIRAIAPDALPVLASTSRPIESAPAKGRCVQCLQDRRNACKPIRGLSQVGNVCAKCSNYVCKQHIEQFICGQCVSSEALEQSNTLEN